MRSNAIGRLLLAITLLYAVAANLVFSANFDPNTIWPLCGRINESPPAGWVDTDGCPASRFGDPTYSDEPLSSTFGPRPLASENNRYDFHRGVDIATPIGTPFFAITDGTIEIAGNHSSYSDPLIKLRHFRPGETSCNAGGCYHSYYLHIDSWVVNENDPVIKGQLLGYTGASGASGFEHLHFEVRNAPASDVLSAWSRDAIHPLSVMPYAAPNNTSMVFNNVDFSNPNPSTGRVDLTLTSNRFDLVYVGLTLLDSSQQPIVQSGNTPNANGYYVRPPFFDMELWNSQYSHKDSTNFPWESYGTGGIHECPYHADHLASYSANVHMDRPDPADFHEGLFNGLHIRTQKYWPSDVSDYTVDMDFHALEGSAACVQVNAVFASGDSALAEWGNCTGAPNQSPIAAMTWSCQGFGCDFDGAPSTDPDGSVVSYAWDFGDGNVASGATPSHTYAAAGSYQVVLTVTDNEAASNNTTETASVTEPLLVRGPYLQMQTDDGITVHWRTDIPTDSVVRYGASAGNLSSSVVIAGARTEHAVELTGLGAAQKYWYSVGDSIAPIGGDSSYHFSTAPVQGVASDTRMWVLGDSGTATSSARAVRDAYKAWAASDPADLLLMLGDNAYNDGTDAEYQAAVFDTYPEILRQTPWFSTLGNHDGHTADSATQTGPYYDILNLPANGEIGGLASGTEAYYSFDYANVHFISLDSYETSRSPAGAMLTWLESDLALNTQPWVIAIWHHPPYSKGSHNSDTEGRLIDMRQNALPIFENWGVDLVMSGHSHSYERSYLLDGHYGDSSSLDLVANVLDPGDGNETGDGVYEKPDIIAAAREGAVYAVAGSSGKVSSASLDHPAMFVSVSSLGSLVVDVSGNRMDVVFLDDTGSVRDEFSIQKGPDLEPPLLSATAAEDATHVLVDFNEALDALEATNPANYTVAGLTVSLAELLVGERSVRLTTSTMTPDANYTLVVHNVQDAALNTILPNSSINFDFFDIMTVSYQDGLAPEPTYDGTMDAYIREASPDTVYGLETTLQADGSEPSGTETDMSILLGWDLSSIPTNAIVQDASFELEVTNASSGPYYCYPLLRGWDETQVTWNQAASAAPWGSPGADAGSDSDGQALLCTVSAGSTGSLTVNLTAEGLAQVQSWVNDPSSNHGMLITDPNNSNGADFHSRESSNALARPRLNVTYRVPAGGGNIDPVAGFTSACNNLGCDFTDTSSDSDGTVTAWSWDFGDGNSSTTQNPTHSFGAEGDYTVNLTVTDNDGGTNQSSTLVSVVQLIDPVAGFSHTCTGLDCNFTDTSTDSDGTLTGWSWDFGDGNSSTLQNPAHSYAGTGNYTVNLTVTDDDGLTDVTSIAVPVSEPMPWVDHFAEADLGGSGTVSGSYTDTQNDDGATQSITEIESGGRKSNRYSYLQKTWQFTVVPGSMVTLYANAWSSVSGDGDAYVFSWSSDNSNFNDLFAVSSTDPANQQSGLIPADGTIYIRVRDTDRGQGNGDLDTVFVDHLYIRSENGAIPDPPLAPTNLQVTGKTSDSVSLSWSHLSADETGFDLERSLSGSGNWLLAASPAGGASAHTDGNLSSATAYDYRIRARNAGGVSAWSNGVTETTDAAAPITLTANGTVKRGEHEVKLTWSNATSDSVDVIRDGIVIATTPNNGKYTDRTGNSGSRTYRYQVCEGGTGICSNEVTVVY